MNEQLFEPLQVGPHTLRNRWVMPAMHLGLCRDGHVSNEELRFYGARAKSDVALVMVGLCNTYADDTSTIAGVLELSHDEHIGSMRRLHQVIADGGAKSAVQLSPISGYNNPAWSPDEAQLVELIESIGLAAGRAQQAGFDFVELMLSGGSVLSHMLSSHHNTGKLAEYSGSLENRLRAPLAALQSIQSHAPGMPMMVRMHGHEYLETGYGLEEAARIAKAMAAQGVCAINVTVAGHRTSVPQITRQRTCESFSFLGRNIKDAVDVPVFYGSRIRSLEDAKRVFDEAGVDAVTVGRSLIADEAFVRKMKDAAEKETKSHDADVTVNCTACCHCLDMAFSKKPVRCTVNPDVRMDGSLGVLQDKVFPGDVVVVAGSGPAGLRAAIALAEKQAHVMLVERERELGGKWRHISRLTGHRDLQGALEGYKKRLAALQVQVQLETEVTPYLVQRIAPKILVWAVGASSRAVSIPGIECHPRVMHVEELIAVSSRPRFEDAVIIGGNAAGLTAALHLANCGYASNEAVGYLHRFGSEKWAKEALNFSPNRRVTVLKRRGFFGKGMGRAMRWTAVSEMEQFGVTAMDKIQYDKVERDGVWVWKGKAKERVFVPADLIVLSTGFTSAELAAEFELLGTQVFVIGDAKAVGNLTAATHGLAEAKRGAVKKIDVGMI